MANNRVTVQTDRFTEFALVGDQAPTPPPPPLPPLTITPNGGSIASPDANVSLEFPAGAVTETVAVTYTDLLTPSHILSPERRTMRSFNLEARAASGQAVTTFNLPYTLVITYTDEQLASRNVDERTLNVAFWDGGAWVDTLPCASCGVDTAGNRITVRLDRFAEFALVGNIRHIDAIRHQLFLPLVRR
jgi:hypothetical protein